MPPLPRSRRCRGSDITDNSRLSRDGAALSSFIQRTRDQCVTGKIINSSTGKRARSHPKEKPEHLPNPSTCRIRALAESEHLPKVETEHLPKMELNYSV
jgi:hypothetical protein